MTTITDELLAVLESLEWNGDVLEYQNMVCPSCRGWKHDEGHAEGCELNTALLKARGQ